MSRYFDLVDGLIGECGGTIDKHIGDAVMGVFGAPVAYGNDTLRALRAAGENPAAGIKVLGVSALAGGFGKLLAASGLRFIPDSSLASGFIGKG